MMHTSYMVMPQMNLDDVFLEKEAIAADIKEQLTKSMSTYGYLIIRKFWRRDVCSAHESA